MPMIRNSLPRVAPRADSTRSLGSGLALIGLALSCAACGQSPTVLTAFRTEAQAQAHCPKDTVVWLDPQSAAYYLKEQGSYGRSNAGRYACRGEADLAGLRGMPN
jgi:hypothetical protein